MIVTRIFDDLRIVAHIAEGDVQVADVARALRAWFEHEQFDPDTPVLWDFVQATATLPWRDAVTFADRYGDYVNANRPAGKTAFVLADAVAARAIESVTSHFAWKTQWRMFTDARAAVDWLTAVEDDET